MLVTQLRYSSVPKSVAVFSPSCNNNNLNFRLQYTFYFVRETCSNVGGMHEVQLLDSSNPGYRGRMHDGNLAATVSMIELTLFHII